MKGDGTGAFYTPRRLFAVAPLNQTPERRPKPCFVKIVDVNNDGRMDVITSNADEGTLGVLLNMTPP